MPPLLAALFATFCHSIDAAMPCHDALCHAMPPCFHAIAAMMLRQRYAFFARYERVTLYAMLFRHCRLLLMFAMMF